MIVCRLWYFEMLLVTVPEKADASVMGNCTGCPCVDANSFSSSDSLIAIENGRFVKSCGFPARLLCALLEAASRVSSTKHKVVVKVFMVQILDVSTTAALPLLKLKRGIYKNIMQVSKKIEP